MSGGIGPGGPSQIAQLQIGGGPPAGLPGEAGQAGENQRRCRIARRHGPVIGLLCPGDELFPIRRVGVKTAVFPVKKLLQQPCRQVPGLRQIGGPEGHAVEFQQAPGAEGVIIQLSGVGRLPRPPSGQQTTVFLCEAPLQKCRGSHGGVPIAGLIQGQSRPGQGRNHQSIPCGKHLVVPVEAGPFQAVGIHPLPQGPDAHRLPLDLFPAD